MSNPEEPHRAVIEVRSPRYFSLGAVLVFSAYGLALLLPALFSMLIVSSVPFSWMTYAIPLCALGFATALLPFGFGNTYAERLAGRYKPQPIDGAPPVLVQITFWPRVRSGVRSVIEDADDIGWIYWTDSQLIFQGDSVSLRVPLTSLRFLRLENSGMRAMFLYSRVRIETQEPVAQKFWIAERSSWNLLGSRATGRALFRGISRAVGQLPKKS